MRHAPIIRPRQYQRLLVFAFLLAAAFGGLGYRLVDIQVVRHEEFLREALQNQRKTMVRPTQRAPIYDIRRQVLATSVPVKTVCANPLRVGERRQELAQLLTPILGIPWEQLAKRMEPRQFINQAGEKRDLEYVVLKRKVALEDWERIQAVIGGLKLKRDTIFTDRVDGEKRLYPNGSLAAHVLGFTGISNERAASVWAEQLVGKSGIEASMNAVLSGTLGLREIIRDVKQNELTALRPLDVAPRTGFGVVLTLDAGLQHIVESEIEEAYLQHSPNSVSCVVVRPQTGEILAMANLPTFDPNRPGEAPQGHWRNRAITDVAEPGSTFKTLVVAGALSEQLVNLNTVFDCENGYFVFKRQSLRDVHAYGRLRVEDIVAKSSNIGAAKIGILLGEERLYHFMRAFGMGEPTRILLGGEVGGLLRSPKSWSKISVAWIPMGHEIATTPLQMVMAVSAIANGGRLMRPMLVSALVDDEGQPFVQLQPTVVRQVITEAAARQITQALKTAVASGTGKKAQMEFYEVAGKTGTAQKVINGTYSHTKHFASFIGFFPADDPELCISVVLDEPHKGMYGGETAAPVFRRIAERASSYLGILPTRGMETSLLTGPTPGINSGGRL